MLKCCKDSQQSDIKALGRVMKEIMEPGDARVNPRKIELNRPEAWSQDIRDFQALTTTSSISELLQVSLVSIMLQGRANS
jgi:hypothetical protein